MIYPYKAERELFNNPEVIKIHAYTNDAQSSIKNIAVFGTIQYKKFHD